MSALLTAMAAGVPLAAGWSAHLVWLRGRLNTARRDPLTGLWTRDAFTRRAVRLLRDPHAVVVLADVDHFKHVNDTHGHAAGDALLAATAARLAHYTGRSGVAGRLGGDEFAAVVIDRDGTAADLLAVLGGVLARPCRGHRPGRAHHGLARVGPRRGLPRRRPLRAAAPGRRGDVRGQARPGRGAPGRDRQPARIPHRPPGRSARHAGGGGGGMSRFYDPAGDTLRHPDLPLPPRTRRLRHPASTAGQGAAAGRTAGRRTTHVVLPQGSRRCPHRAPATAPTARCPSGR